MPAYIVSRVSIEDGETMKGYMLDAPSTVEAYGGRYLVRTGDIQVLEGEADYDRMVVLEFPDRDKALAWYNSAEYRGLRQTRWDAADAHIVVLPGEIV
ncbi:MAG: DUF1330 domain-containing protein [Hyphomicrobiales bacterium]|nr:DUF1330 domain-containing protein [Hyphomicrobiales bacterium]MCP4997982.1 DUF1330 domain-containing protein [Hyphomicrobiales bacterium]